MTVIDRPDAIRIEDGNLRADDAGTFHAGDATLDGGGRQMHSLANHPLRSGHVLLQDDQDREIKRVEFRTAAPGGG